MLRVDSRPSRHPCYRVRTAAGISNLRHGVSLVETAFQAYVDILDRSAGSAGNTIKGTRIRFRLLTGDSLKPDIWTNSCRSFPTTKQNRDCQWRGPGRRFRKRGYLQAECMSASSLTQQYRLMPCLLVGAADRVCRPMRLPGLSLSIESLTRPHGRQMYLTSRSAQQWMTSSMGTMERSLPTGKPGPESPIP